MATCGSGVDEVLSARRRATGRDSACCRSSAARLRLRSAPSSADHRRHGDFGATGDGRRSVRSARKPCILRLARALWTARGTRRRARLSDCASRQRRRGDRCDRSRAVDCVQLPRHGLHDQVDRRVSAERGLSARLRDEPDRRNTALPLSRFLGAPVTDDARAGLSHQGDGLSDIEPVQARSQNSSRCLLEQLPALRSQPEHRRAGGRGRRDARRDESRVRRCRARFARRAAR